MRHRSPARLLVAFLLAQPAWYLTPEEARASQLIDRNASQVELRVDSAGRALLRYRKEGKRREVLAWGAVDARPPSPTVPQVAFRLDYSGGRAGVRSTAAIGRNVCGRYRGPALAWLVTACTAPDGTHWAVQRWQRALPNYGLRPTTAQQAWELRLSHFTGEPAVLAIQTNWAYRRFDHLFGTLTYRGQPVYGFRSTPTGVPLDSHGRNIYVDTLNSAYGPGWKRENSFLSHRPTGVFCYGLYRHGTRPPGAGERYRATVIGPGVTPDVSWEGTPPGPYDPQRDQELAASQAQLYGADPLCKPV